MNSLSGHRGAKNILPVIGFCKGDLTTGMFFISEEACFDFTLPQREGHGEVELQFGKRLEQVLPSLSRALDRPGLVKLGIKNVNDDGSTFVLVGYNGGAENCEMLMVKEDTSSVTPKEMMVTYRDYIDSTILKVFAEYEEREARASSKGGVKRSRGEVIQVDSGDDEIEEPSRKSRRVKEATKTGTTTTTTSAACHCPVKGQTMIQSGLYKGRLQFKNRILGEVEVYLKLEESLTWSALISYTDHRGTVFGSRSGAVKLAPRYDGKKQRFRPSSVPSDGTKALDNILSRMESSLRKAGMHLEKGIFNHENLFITHDDENDSQIVMEFNGGPSAAQTLFRLTLRRGRM
ncbi:hypothetical protein FOL47_009362 [Perkinsus chesapeaki]|uniref:Uncharacterized protein n=1 Tax=Perkinsus chesapeaki TaxID=330153 RepID=A0A7J6L8P0_PERCH|nr:hypothetical protein FOL47_009362 [Perkinsus chesapeaki]